MAVGIVRRIDELGRIVIPKEMRKTMRLQVGDEMEICASVLLQGGCKTSCQSNGQGRFARECKRGRRCGRQKQKDVSKSKNHRFFFKRIAQEKGRVFAG